MGLCCYLILLHGLRFTPDLEAAWVIASVVSALQELLIQPAKPSAPLPRPRVLSIQRRPATPQSPLREEPLPPPNTRGGYL